MPTLVWKEASCGGGHIACDQQGILHYFIWPTIRGGKVGPSRGPIVKGYRLYKVGVKKNTVISDHPTLAEAKEAVARLGAQA